METSDGRDISHLLHGESGDVRKVAVTEFAWSKSVRKGDWRLVYYPPEMFAEDYPEGFGELYNLADDPWEMQNLFLDPAHRARVEELRADLVEWLITTTRPATVLTSTPPQSEQAITRYHNTTNRDGKIHPENLHGLRSNNYL